MPRVPYNPVPEVSPANAPAPRISIATPPAAFGVGIADSIERFGGTADKVGNELFERAYAMQQLRNETESNEAVAEAEKRGSLLYENFKSQQGLNAVNGFQKYQADLEAGRKEVRDGLSNDMVRKMYDRSATSLTNRLMTYGAGHAAQQNKVAADGAALAGIKTVQDRILQNPDDDIGYRNGVNEIVDKTHIQADIRGWGKDEIDQNVTKNVSALMRSRIDGVNRTDPDKAKQMLEANRQYMHYEDVNHLEPKIQQQTRIVGSRNISDAVNKGWAPYMTPAQIDRMSGVQEPLARILQQAQRDNPNLQILPVSGYRTTAEQAEIRARHEAMPGGVFAHPAAKPGESYHNYGRAFDVVPGANTTYAQIGVAIKAASTKLGIPLSPEHDRLGDRDPGHFSIPKDYDVGSAPKKVEEAEQSRIDRARDFAAKQYPDDPLYADIARDRTQADFRHQKEVQHNQDIANNQTLTQLMMDRGDGHPAKIIDEILANPQGRSAYDALDPGEQAKWQGKINTYNNSIAQKTDEAYLTQLRGMKETDRDGFMGVNAFDPKLPLSQPARRQVIAWQSEKRKDPTTSLRIQQAQHILGPTLAGVIDKKDDENEYWEFWGAMDDAMNYEVQRTGKQLSFDEVKKIGDRLLYTITPKGWFSSAVQIFNRGDSTTREERDAIRAAMLRDNPYADISDRAITRALALKYYKDMGKGATAPK